MINRRVAALLVLVAPLAACVSGSESTAPSPNPNAAFTARFTPLDGIMPFPNDLYFNGSTTGTLNIPGSALVPQNAPLLALNHLDGYGTESDISIYFTQPVDATTLATGVVVLQVTSDPATKAVTGFTKALVPGTDYSIGLSAGIDSGGEIVTIKPLKPLTPSTVTGGGTTVTPATYLVIVTTGVKDSTGTPVAPSSDFGTIVAADLPALSPSVNPANINMAPTNPLFPVAEFTLGQLAVAAGAGVTPGNVAVTFSFSTAYLGLSLAELSASATATTQPTGTNATAILDTGETVCDILAASGQLPNNTTACAAVPGSNATEVFAGTVALPYYLTVPTTGSKAAITDSWHNAAGGDTAISATDATSLLPAATKAQNIIPVIVTLPKAGSGCTMPGSGWPTVIFQHGITRNREDVFGIASTLVLGGATSGFCTAVVAIDLPLHGVTNTADPFYQNQLFASAAPNLVTGERTFNMDATGAAGATANIDGSGQLFINLNSTITSRDNLREGAADLINLAATLPTLHAVTPGASPVVNNFDGSKLFYVGHSLGGIVGTVFLGADAGGHLLLGGPSRIVAASLANPGGHIAELLRNSPSFEPVIDGQLAANGLVKGSQSYYDFYSEAQAVVEDGDPANYAALAVGGHPIHMLEVVGGLTGPGDTCNLQDQVVPNLSTDLLVSLMGLTTTTKTAGTSGTVVGSTPIVRFLAGDHGSVLSPSVPGNCTNNTTNQQIYGAVTQEMQTEIVSFLASAGAAVQVNNTAGIVQ